MRQPHPNHDKSMIPQPDTESPQPVAKAESLVRVASTDLLAVGFKLETSTERFWHWSESPGIELIDGKWFPCDMLDNGDMQYSDDGYESPVEAAKQAVRFFS